MNRRSIRRTARTGIWNIPEPPPPADGSESAGGEAAAAGGTTGSGGGGEGAGAQERMLPQAEVTRIVTNEARKSAEKAANDLAAQLGVPVADAVEIIKAHQARVEGEKSEAQRAREAADAEKAEAAKEREAAALETYNARADRALLAAGVSGDENGGEDRLSAVRGMLQTKPGATAEEVKAEVARIKILFPALFEVSTSTTPPAPGSDPKGRPPAHGAGTDPIKRGQERAKARYNTQDRPKPPGLTR